MFAGERLPGIGIEVAPRRRDDDLPRMDVAVFAGFAERGPAHVAIAVDSVAGYRATFGGDAPLAWDVAAGQTITANLAQTVRAFFSNGGTRCWVVRLCETRELAALRIVAGVSPGEPLVPAQAGQFLLSGVLSRRPSADGLRAEVEPAMLQAASLGSWSDNVGLSARVEHQPFVIANPERVRRGLRFADPGLLSIGDLVELSGGDGRVTRYAKVVRLGGGWAWAAWVASFAALDQALPSVAGLADLAGGQIDVASTCEEGSVCSVAILADVALPKAGRWLRFTREGEAVWLKVGRVDGQTIIGPAWQQIGSRLSGGQLKGARVTLGLRAASAAGSRIHEGLGLGAEAAGAIQSLVDDDLYYEPRDLRVATERLAFALTRDESERIALGYRAASGGFAGASLRFGDPLFSNADRVALRSAWLPIGLDGQFGPEDSALPEVLEPIERDGLGRLDARLFLDPRLAEARARTLADQAAAIRFGDGAPLMGIHAALDMAGESFPEASILAVPDAAQPGWEKTAPVDLLPPPQPGAPMQPDWLTHHGGCPPRGEGATLAGPDAGRFLDCATELLVPPQLVGPSGAVTDGRIALSWAVQPNGTRVVVEEATRADFSDAAVVGDEIGLADLTLSDRTEGVWYYRLHIERGGNVSAYSAIVLAVRHSRYRTVDPDPATLAAIHVGAMRLAGGIGDYFALLSLPKALRADRARSYAVSLADVAPGVGSAGQLGADEVRLLSYAALYHPWIVSRGNQSCTPDGAVAGTLAARARTRGAWIAPANVPLADVIGLDPVIDEGDLLPLDRARVNVVRRRPGDFALLDADTLSIEPDWRQVNVRRLMQLLRRMALRRGLLHVFEPNGPVIRRALQRGFTTMLDGLQQRGAFAGDRSELSFRVNIEDSDADRDNGRLVAEIAVAPAQPMRFLTVRLIQQGARLALVEEA